MLQNLVFNLTRYINPWILRHSKDATLAFCTTSVQNRTSMREVLAAYPDIRQEALLALPTATSIQGDLFFGNDVTDDGKWKKYYLKWYAKPSRKAWCQFPKTLTVIERHADIHLAMLSILDAGAIIKPHCGPWTGSIRVHLGLVTPNSADCYISVGNEHYFWQDGELVAFNDTLEHFVVNNTPQQRIVLFMDIERRMNQPWQQWIVHLLNISVGRLTTRE